MNFTQQTKELFLDTNNSCLNKQNYYYLYETDKIKEIENYLSTGFKPYEKQYTRDFIKYYSIYNITIKRPEPKYKSVVIKINIQCFLTLKLDIFKIINIHTKDKIEFKLNEEKSFEIYELNQTNNDYINNVENKFYIYFEQNSLKSLQVDIYKNYSDISIDEFGKKITNSYFRSNLEESDFVELDNLNGHIFIVLSNFLKNEDTIHNTFRILRSCEYNDITFDSLFKCNLKFKKTTERRTLSFKLNTKKEIFKYLHFQINSNQKSQIEYLEFKNQNNQSVKYENNCINLTNYSNQTIFMTFGLSSISSMDNYDIILRQSDYYLYYPFFNNKVEIPFIKTYSFYVYSYFSYNIGFSFIINTKQEEIEYYY